MKAFALVVVAVVGLPASLALAEPPASVVLNPHVKTDKSVDTSTIDAILAGLVKRGMTDEQKVLACFHWTRRLLVHGDGPRELAYDFHKMINIMGNGSCLRQTTPLAELLKRLGYEVESWAHDGHHMMQVKYGGQWHCLDPHMCFYVYDRATPPVLASIQQLQDDPSLSLEAVKEQRACPGFLLCGDGPETFAGKGGKWVREGPFPKLTIDEPFGRIALPRGASYVRTWQVGSVWFKRGSWMPQSGPVHNCGRRDNKDLVNWPLYEPHVAAINNGLYYRHWADGWIAYKPNLRGDHYLDAVVSRDNLQHDAARGLVAADAGKPANNPHQLMADKPGEVVFAVDCPYVMTAGDLSLAKPLQGKLSAGVSIDKGKTWKPVELAEKDGRLAASFVDEINGSFEGYRLKLTLEGGAAVDGLELASHFQLNPYSLPYLVPGENVVSVEGERFGSPLTVQWQHAEGPEWKEIKKVVQEFTKAGQFTIRVNGEKYPRNVALTLSVAP